MKAFLMVLSLWIVLTVVTGRFESSSDGYSELGFPFVFYRSFSGKCTECADTGVLWRGVVLDCGIVLLTAYILHLMLKNWLEVDIIFLFL